MAKSPISGKPPNRLPLIPSESSGKGGNFGSVLTFQQAISGVVSPQYQSANSSLLQSGTSALDLDMLHDSSAGFNSNAMENTKISSNNVPYADSPSVNEDSGGSFNMDSPTNHFAAAYLASSSGGRMSGVGASNFVGGSSILHGSSATIGQFGSRQRQRLRTSSMPAESRKVRNICMQL